jgi:myo-inositol-1(or 4)-monophosphatase
MKIKSKTNQGILRSLIRIVKDIITKYSDILIQMSISGNRKEIDIKKHKDNFVSQVDIELHREYSEKLSHLLSSFIYASEEGEPQIYPLECKNFPEFLVIVDPLDTSELAVRGLCGYTHVLVYSLKEQAPIACIVGDMFHETQIFYAFRHQTGNDKAFLMTRSGKVLPIRSSREKNLHKAIITNYSMPPRERFMKIAEQKILIDALSQPDEHGQKRGRIGLDFGSIGLCHVAAGFSDAMIEVAKGFSIWDLLPGQYILHAAGGITASIDGNELPLNLHIHSLDDVKRMMAKRQKFVAAGNAALLKSILNTLN